MNILLKWSILSVVLLILLALGCITYWQITGRLPEAIIFIWLLNVPILLGSLIFQPKWGPEFDERDRVIMLKSNLIGLGVSWICITLGLTAIGRHEQTVPGQYLT